ncbi:TlpA family protein disulfide reductase [Aestuariimicrobium kwangyangense]|uniref:TlpA family protein disulfide reductase n=1 Tax=Aestuariimicrobium kwangyangense TaxID=396389 RepID=UPI000688D5D5|nr:TlpA disulfide reductase family protein [Aestuariimicrobium kwangyangense]
MVEPLRAPRPGAARSLSRRGLLSGLAAASSLGLVACSSNPSASSDTGFAQGDGSFTRVAVGQRKQLPVLSGHDLDQLALTTQGRKGRVMVINVWGSWCSPCRAEAGHLLEAARKTADVADFIGINTRDLDRAPAQSFVRSFGLTWPSFYDPDGALLMKLTDLPPKAIPSTLLVDPSGGIAGRVLGQVSTSTLVTAIGDLVAGK